MKKDNLIGSVGRRILSIDNSDLSDPITKLSDLGEDWEVPSECPNCKRVLHFNKDNVNSILTCKCGQKIYLEISPDLL